MNPSLPVVPSVATSVATSAATSVAPSVALSGSASDAAERPTGLGRFYLVGFLVLMAFDTLAQVSFKLAGNHALPLEFSLGWLLRVFGQPWIYGALCGYVGAFFTWLSLLKHAPIGPAFAASHLEIVSALVLSHWLFGEHIGPVQLLGGALILAGIVCLAFSEARAAPSAPACAEPAAGSAVR